MTDSIRNILDPGSTSSDDEVLSLLAYARKRKSEVLDTVLFLRRHGHSDLAMDWLREQGDKRLNRLAEILPHLFDKLDQKAVSPMVSIVRTDAPVKQDFGTNANSAVVNL